MEDKKNIYNTSSISIEDLEKQESLTNTIIKNLNAFNSDYLENRPKSNFLDLMEFTLKSFQQHLKCKSLDSVVKFIHNRIAIDGQFLQFALEKKISVNCLHRDSIISWKTDFLQEKFFIQGVFKITAEDCNFITCALMHKGNNNDDEVSFFVLVPTEYYDKYISLRNEFDKWILDRDRSNLKIRVIDGDDISYDRNNSWDEIYLQDEVKKDIISTVENFLLSKDFYVKNKIPWKRGVLLYGPAGTGKSSIIRTIISNYNFKPVTIAAGADDNALRDAFSYAEEQSPSLLFFEDLDSMLDVSINLSNFLNLMDGISAKNGLFIIATTNEIKKLKPNIRDRPSRFDRKIEIGLPPKDMVISYLQNFFGKFLSKKKIEELANIAFKHKFSYAYLKELYISSMFEALSEKKSEPSEKNIDKVINRLIKDKNAIKGGSKVDIDNYTNKE
jgi:hypothetical protein